ncbi:MAG: diguanylate cyclase, partial [Leptospiraceae bacterium]|nr:diguanylate cyclase [Leptospiraceae bacterium]
MNCPKCGAEMENKKIDEIEIDLCTGCAGIFLDDGEFESFTGVDPTTGLLRISKFVRVLSKLNERATIDELTGAYNRKYFNEFMQSVFENQRRGNVTMIAIDIDFFKQFNTKHGHDGGDIVLKELARLIQMM